MLESFRLAVRDVADVVQRARSAKEIFRALAPKRNVLNASNPDEEADGSADDDLSSLDAALKQVCNALKSEAIDADGSVNYASLKTSPTYHRLEKLAARLRGFEPESLTGDAERIAFWINLYNVLAIHAVIAADIETSVMEVPSFFSSMAYQVGPHSYTLDEIENGVLRCNGPHPATKRRLFRTGDPRLASLPSEVDGRIHAALVCASASCPPVAFYDAERLDAQLTLATQNYVAGDVRVDHEKKIISIAITFYYYKPDFLIGGDKTILTFLTKYAEDGHRDDIQTAFDQGYRVDYPRYDWSLNHVV